MYVEWSMVNHMKSHIELVRPGSCRLVCEPFQLLSNFLLVWRSTSAGQLVDIGTGGEWMRAMIH